MMSMRLSSLVAIAAISIALFASVSLLAAPSIEVQTDATEYQAGDTIEVSLGAANSGEPVDVDVYVALLLPGGATWTYSEESWHGDLLPYLGGIQLPASFDFPLTPLFHFGVPEGVLGDFSFAAAMTASGTLDFACDPSLVAFSITEGTASAIDFYVDPELGSDANDGSEASPFKTMTHSLRIASEESERVRINLAAGTYSVSANGETFPLEMTSNTEIVGEERSAKAPGAILDGEYQTRIMNCNDAAGVSLKNIMFFQGKAVDQAGIDRGAALNVVSSVVSISGCGFDSNDARVGAAILVDGGSNIAIEDSTFTYNSAELEAGAIGVFDSAGMVCRSSFSDNTGWRGGAIYKDGEGCDFKISNCEFAGNSATDRGGAVFLSGNTVPSIIEDSTFLCNVAITNGGAIATQNAQVEVARCDFQVNTATGSGGALYFDQNSELEQHIEDSAFVGNTAIVNGAAIAAQGTQVDVNDCEFQGNNAMGSGGAIRISGLNDPVECAVAGSIFKNSSAGGYGGALEAQGASISAVNSEFEANSAGGSGGAVHISGEGAIGRFEDNTFTYGMSSENGGAIAAEGVEVAIDDCKFDTSSAFAKGGAVYVEALNDPVELTVAGSEFVHNSVGEDGGAAFAEGVSVNVSNCDFEGNVASGGGGAFYSESNEELERYFEYSIFTGNVAGVNGGAMGFAGSDDFEVNECEFHSNEAMSLGGAIHAMDSYDWIVQHNRFIASEADSGSAIYGESEGGVPTILDNLFEANAGTTGGALIPSSGCNPTIKNNTFVNNTAGSGHAGAIDGEGGATISDCIFWQNGTDIRGQYMPSYCFFNSPKPGNGNISGDYPGFAADAPGAFYLDPLSPCVNAGSQSADAAGLSDRTTRTDGTPDAGQVDMGYHYPLPAE